MMSRNMNADDSARELTAGINSRNTPSRTGPKQGYPHGQHISSSGKSPLISTDSGFLSGVVSEELDVGTCAASSSQQQAEMKSPVLTDSGLDVGNSFSKSFESLDSKCSAGNDSSGPPQTTELQEYSSRNFSFEDLIRPDEDGDTPLHLAVLQGFIEVVFGLVRVLPHPCLLDIPNNRLQTPLHLAVLTNQPPLVRRLVVGGANVELRDRSGNTPLHLASRDGYVDCVKCLCIPVSSQEREAALLRHNFPPQPLPQDLEQWNYDGQMCLHLAAMNGHLNVVQHLCWFNADVNAAEAKGGRTALHYAVERRQPALLHFLVTKCGASIDAENYSGLSPYQMASASTPMLAALLANLGAQRRPLPEEQSESDDDDQSDDEADVSPQWRPNANSAVAGYGEIVKLAS